MTAETAQTASISRKQLLLLVNQAIQAPSAENTQPWRFDLDRAGISVILDAERRLASDIDSMLDLAGIGACIENLSLAAGQFGFEPIVDVAQQLRTGDDQNEDLAVARLTFSATRELNDPLTHFIDRRCTSRRLTPEKISNSILTRLSHYVDPDGGVRVDWVTQPSEIAVIAKLTGIGNQIRFEHQPFHAEFFGNLRFDPVDVEMTRDGLDVKTLQVPWIVQKVLFFLRYWTRMRIANQCGFARTVALQAASEVRSSGAIGLISVEKPEIMNFISGGRAMQRLWLASTSCDLGFHPIAALPVFLKYTRSNQFLSLLQPRHQNMVRRMATSFHDSFPQLADRELQMAFRLGKCREPGLKSLRRHVKDVMRS